MTCSLFVFEEDGANSPGNNNVSDSYTTVDWLFPKEGRDRNMGNQEKEFSPSQGNLECLTSLKARL